MKQLRLDFMRYRRLTIALNGYRWTLILSSADAGETVTHWIEQGAVVTVRKEAA